MKTNYDERDTLEIPEKEKIENGIRQIQENELLIDIKLFNRYVREYIVQYLLETYNNNHKKSKDWYDGYEFGVIDCFKRIKYKLRAVLANKDSSILSPSIDEEE